MICMLLPILLRPLSSFFNNSMSITDLVPTHWFWRWKQRHTRKLVYVNNLQIGLAAMDSADATSMVQHYVTRRRLTPEESRQFDESYKPITPAELQGVCLACETFEDVIAAYKNIT